MSLFWIGALIVFVPLVVAALFVLAAYLYVRTKFLDTLLRIFEEKPLFVIPRGTPNESAEDVEFKAGDGRTLRGCYFRTETEERKGVILFGLEFGSNRWSCQPYAEDLVRSGYDVFAFEPRNQGESERIPGYEPLHWLTRFELDDTLAAVNYLKRRDDADPEGIGYFGVSKGGGAGLMAASQNKYIRCVVTDGAFSTLGTMVPHMRKFATIYSKSTRLQNFLPDWFYGLVARTAIKCVAKRRKVDYVHLEPALKGLKRPLMMIHGEKDTYIRVPMAQDLYRRAGLPKHFWVVPGAKHNQALHKAGEEYHNRIRGFFDLHLAGIEPGLVQPVSVDVIESPRIATRD
jgi:uncharacterized protein